MRKKDELLKNKTMNVGKVQPITIRANGQPTETIQVTTNSNNRVIAVRNHRKKMAAKPLRNKPMTTTCNAKL